MEPTQSAQPSPEVNISKPNNKLVVGAVVLILLLLTSTGLLAYQNFQLQKQIASLQSTPSPSPSPTPDPTANWKTYTNQKLIFSFKYPDNLVFKDLGNSVIDFSDSKNNTNFNLNGFEILSSVDYQKYLSERKSSGNLQNQKAFTDSQDRLWQTDMGLGEVYNFTGILNQQDKFYVVSLQSGSDQEADGGANFRDFANQILSTFKFVNPTISPSASPSVVY